MNAKDIYKIIMNSYDQKEKRYKLIIWVGAGIDHDEPTGLPLGNKLTEFMIVNSMPDHLLYRYLNCHHELQRKKMLTKIYGQLRLETVIEAYRIVENSILDKSSIHPFLRGFHSFENLPPNDIHMALAKLLKYGANIVTANYDNCINNAYFRLTGHSLKCRRDDSSSFHKGFYTYYSLLPQTGMIYHFHGVAHDIDSLGASLSQLCNGLSLSFQRQIEEWIQNGYTFLFLGYSGGDALDVNPVFQKLSNGIGNTAVFVRYHPQHEQAIPRELMNHYEKTLLKPFVCQIVFEGQLTAIFNIQTTKKYETQKTDWQENYYKKSQKLNGHLRLMVTIVLSCLLGLTSKKLLPGKWWIKAKECEEVESWLINYYGHELANNTNNRRAAKFFSFYDHNSALEQSNLFAAKNDTEKAVSVFGDIKQIYRELGIIVESQTMKIDWNISTPLNRMTDYVLKNDNLNSKDIDDLLKSLYMIITNRHKIIDILQYTTALRAYGVLLVIYKGNIKGINALQESMELYQEINSQKGIIKTLYFFKQCYKKYPENISYIDLLKKRMQVNHQIISMIISYKQFQYIKKFICNMAMKYFDKR